MQVVQIRVDAEFFVVVFSYIFRDIISGKPEEMPREMPVGNITYL